MKFFSHFRCNIPEKYKHTIENIEKDKFNEKYDNVVLSCYFNGKRDPIHHQDLKNEKQEANNFNYIKPLYETCKNHKLHLIIFHDNLSKDFIKKYSTDRIIFRRVQLVSDLSINDERFIIYYEYLLQNPYKNVLSSDVSDVYINKNPFDLIDTYHIKDEVLSKKILDSGFLGEENLREKMKDHPDLGYFLEYVGTYITSKEINFIFNAIIDDHDKNRYKIFIGTNSLNHLPFEKMQPWFERRKGKLDLFNEAIKNKMPYFKAGPYQIYNPGTIMAKYFNYMCFLKNMMETLFHLAGKLESGNWNMMIATYLIKTFLFEGINHKNACTRYIYTGYPFNSIYKRREKIGISPSYLIHK